MRVAHCVTLFLFFRMRLHLLLIFVNLSVIESIWLLQPLPNIALKTEEYMGV